MLRVKSYSDAAYDEIKERIISGIYKPGEVLNERQLSNDFGISRTPVREAMQKLSFEGWILNEPYKKNFVREFNLEYILEAQKVRTALEILAIEEFSKDLKEEDIKILENLLNKQRNSSDYNEFIKIDREFHEYIYTNSNNSILFSLMENINDIIRYFGLIALNIEGRNIKTIKEHENILKALKSKDINLIKASMDEHMENTVSAIIKRYDKINKKK
ncbi:MAG: GntR family transcriptional regulator [Peptoniphilaceae bacterium]